MNWHNNAAKKVPASITNDVNADGQVAKCSKGPERMDGLDGVVASNSDSTVACRNLP